MVLQKHRDSFITAADFQYLRSIGINAVRIPVGYWIASDPNPPKPFIPGSLQALDNAFRWAE
jgi:aryl-phospho-beta-D-glucosidase BglC (GH1 family)